MLLPPQVLPFLMHPDADVRGHAANYFAGLGDRAPGETADELWKAIDQFGDLPMEFGLKQQQTFLRALCEVPSNDLSLTRAMALLRTCASDEDCTFVTSRIFLSTPIESLQARHGEILPLVPPKFRIALNHRLSLQEKTAEQLWTQLTELAAQAEASDKFDQQFASKVIEALARHPDVSVPLAMAVLEDPRDRWWLEIWCCDLLGQLMHLPAIDLLLPKMEIEDADYLRESAGAALARMPAEMVVPKLEAAYHSDDPFQRMAIADVLGKVKDPLAEAALLRAFPNEESETAITGISIALCDLCTTDGLEQLRQVVIDERYDMQVADIKEMLVTLATMTGYAPPELKEWKRKLKDPVYKGKLREKLLSSFGMDNKMIEQFRGYLAGKPVKEEPEENPAAMPRSLAAPGTIRRTEPKIGRNDPCPCGSGKKYKKCCGNYA